MFMLVLRTILCYKYCVLYNCTGAMLGFRKKLFTPPCIAMCNSSPCVVCVRILVRTSSLVGRLD